MAPVPDIKPKNPNLMPEYRTPLPAMLAASMQSGLNAVLALDPNSGARLDRIDGQVLRLELQGAGIELYFTASHQQFQVSLNNPLGDEADATVIGTPAALFSMAADELGSGWSGPDSKVNISGDAALARDFERLFSRLDPDFESALSGLFGDVAGHQLAIGLKEGVRRVRETAGEAGDVFGEVFREGLRGGKSGPLVGSDEMQRFTEGIDELRDAVERLEAKVRIVTEKSENDGGGES
jgi:ubiquinone biosynthesis protein UbiJ